MIIRSFLFYVFGFTRFHLNYLSLIYKKNVVRTLAKPRRVGSPELPVHVALPCIAAGVSPANKAKKISIIMQGDIEKSARFGRRD